MTRTLPDRNRWVGWVVLAWLLAGLAVVAGVAIIAVMGTMEVPEQSLYGDVTWRDEPNPLIWGAAIGQALAALLLAAIFSILNSTYQNSCDILRLQLAGEEEQAHKPLVDAVEPQREGSLVKEVAHDSPLYGVIKPGYRIARVNGHNISSI